MSRFITYPSIEPRSQDHTIVLIDASTSDIENVGLFCKTSFKEYDIYLYRSDLDDLNWLSSAVANSDMVLINETSTVYINNHDNLTKFGPNEPLLDPLVYFQNYDQ